MTNQPTGLSFALLSIAALGLACQGGPFANVHAARGEPVALAQLTGTPWIVMEIGGEPVVAPPDGRGRASLVFKSELEVIGSGGCNDFSGRVSGESADVRFGPFSATRKMCPEEMMEQEKRYLKALAEGGRLEIGMQNLFLIDAKGATSVRFVEAAEHREWTE